jgi:hypothetical protein
MFEQVEEILPDNSLCYLKDVTGKDEEKSNVEVPGLSDLPFSEYEYDYNGGNQPKGQIQYFMTAEQHFSPCFLRKINEPSV